MGKINEIKILTVIMEGSEIEMLRDIIKEQNIKATETEIEPNKVRFKMKLTQEQKHHVNMLLGFLELFD